MNARFILLAAFVAGSVSLGSAQLASKPAAAPAAPAPPTPPRVARDPAARSNAYARTGGMVQAPATGPTVLFLNTQKRVPAATLQAAAADIQKFVHLPCSVADAAATEPAADAARALADKNNAAVVVVCEAAGQPSLLVAPENRWAVLNVAALAAGNAPAEKVGERVRKQMWRSFGYVMGAANSGFEHCLLKPVFSPADLDALDCQTICPEPIAKMFAQAQKIGVKPVRMVSYRKAAEEGWAPQPTNDVQRAIWKELRK
jgi:hypothetical protein